jgi:hypothetical protein
MYTTYTMRLAINARNKLIFNWYNQNRASHPLLLFYSLYVAIVLGGVGRSPGGCAHDYIRFLLAVPRRAYLRRPSGWVCACSAASTSPRFRRTARPILWARNLSAFIHS